MNFFYKESKLKKNIIFSVGGGGGVRGGGTRVSDFLQRIQI